MHTFVQEDRMFYTKALIQKRLTFTLDFFMIMVQTLKEDKKNCVLGVIPKLISISDPNI